MSDTAELKSKLMRLISSLILKLANEQENKPQTSTESLLNIAASLETLTKSIGEIADQSQEQRNAEAESRRLNYLLKVVNDRMATERKLDRPGLDALMDLSDMGVNIL